jgi:hypothetical protein
MSSDKKVIMEWIMDWSLYTELSKNLAQIDGDDSLEIVCASLSKLIMQNIMMH